MKFRQCSYDLSGLPDTLIFLAGIQHEGRTFVMSTIDVVVSAVSDTAVFGKSPVMVCDLFPRSDSRTEELPSAK
jgi:hypothetical protein